MTVSPPTAPLDNPEIHCRLWNEKGIYQIRLVQDDQTALTLAYDNMGGMTASLLDSSGSPIWTGETARNAHGRESWVDVAIALNDDHIQVYTNGVLRLDEILPQELSGLHLQFQTPKAALIRIDDCLILGSYPDSTGSS